MSMLLRAFGGLLAGAGEGIVDAAKQKREDALALVKRNQDLSDKAADHTFTASQNALAEAGANTRNTNTIAGELTRTKLTESGAGARTSAEIAAANARDAANRTATQGTVDKYITRDDGTIVGVDHTGRVVQITDGTGKPVRTETEMTPADARFIKILETRHKVADPNGIDPPTVDYNAVDADLRKAGKGALADRYSGIQSGTAPAKPPVLGPDGTPATARGPAPVTAPKPVDYMGMIQKAGGIDAAIASTPDDTTAKNLADYITKNGLAGAIAKPPKLASEPDGTLVTDKSGKYFKVQGSLLVPTAKPLGR